MMKKGEWGTKVYRRSQEQPSNQSRQINLPGASRGGKIRDGAGSARLMPVLSLIIICFGLLAAASPVLGAGFALQQQGVAAMGQGNAYVADASDPTAIFYNPAGISQLKRPQVFVSTVFQYPDREYDGGALGTSETNHRIFKALQAYFAAPINDRVAVGLGLFTPFGLGSQWPPTWQGRYITTSSEMKTWNVNPTISVKLMDNLSFAVGFDVMWSAVAMKKRTPTFFGDAELDLTGDGHGYGYNLGLLYAPIPDLKLGVSYRSGIDVKHNGNLNFKILQPPIPLPAINRNGTAEISYPPMVTWGVSYSGVKPWTFLFDVNWTGWSSYDALTLKLNDRLFGSRNLTTPKDWKDAFAFRFGANYEIQPGMKLRAGYIYDMTPVPDATFEPQLPDNNRHIFCVGAEYKYKRLILGIAYNYILIEERTKNNVIATNGVPAALQANGTYNGNVHSLGISAGFEF